MPHPPRCHLDRLDDDEPALERAVRHHLERVLRLPPGALVECTDGRGGLARGRWLGQGHLRIEERFPPVPPASEPVRLAVTAPRASRLDWLVEKAVELDVDELLLLQTERSVGDPGDERVGRLRRKAGEAALQCRRLHWMTIAHAVPLPAALERARPGEVWLASPPADGRPSPAPRTLGPLLLLVGPEGGFTPAEEALALAAGALPVTLGRTILRVETAALALAVLARALRH